MMAAVSPSYSLAGTTEAAVAGLEDDDDDHESGGEAEGEGVSVVEGHFSGSCLEAGDHPPRDRRPM